MKSRYGDRDTVGTQYIEAQKNHTPLVCEDISNPLSSSMVEDLNDTVKSNPFEGRPFYITFDEKWDLMMKKELKRRIIKTLYRPYPENNTKVFYTDPKAQKTYYCWELPHHSELANTLIHEHTHDAGYIRHVKEWMNNDLSNFGFIKVTLGSSQVEGYEEKTIQMYQKYYYEYCKNQGLDAKSLETEKKFGFFWIPNNKFKYKDITDSKPKISLVGV